MELEKRYVSCPNGALQLYSIIQHRSTPCAQRKSVTNKGCILGAVLPCMKTSGSSLLAVRRSRRYAQKCKAFSDEEVQPRLTQQKVNPFQGYGQESDAIQKFLATTPQAALLAIAVVGIGASGLAGSLLASQAPVAQKTAARILGAAVASGVALFGAKRLQEKREAGAVTDLYQALARHQNIDGLTAEEVAAVNAKYGIDLAVKRATEVKAVYDTFLESVIPVTGSLNGDEVQRITSFKQVLGLSAEDAAAAHIDVGRRFLRLSNEAGSREERSEFRKALNKLIYVSGLTFGERQEAFLLPWKRICGYTDATLYVAKRDQAKALFRSHLDARGGLVSISIRGKTAQRAALQADRGVLKEIKSFQQKVRLEDGIAEEAVREAARAHIEQSLERAIQCHKRRTRVRDFSDLVAEVRGVVDYAREMEKLAGDPELPPGLGKTTIYGGSLESRSSELRDLFRTFLEEQLRTGKSMTYELEDDLTDLQQILGLGKKEAADITSEVTSKVYRSLLREEVTSGRLDAAASKADVLADLCDRLNFDPEAASALHKQLYRQKLDQLLQKKHLTDEDAGELDRQRRLLCIKKADIQQLHRETCGQIYSRAVEDALNAGHERFSGRDREAVMAALKSVRLDASLAKTILGDSVRKAFLGFIGRSRNKANRLEAAKELKALVFFSNFVVTPLLEDLNGLLNQAANAEQEAAKREIAELMIKAKEQAEKEEAAAAASAVKPEEEAAVAEAEEGADPQVEEAEASEESAAEPAASPESPEEGDMPESLRKSQASASKEEASTSGQRSQKEITLREELEQRDRLDIYRNFLLYCMSGNVVSLPMGTSVQIQRDESEFARLAQLGDILGLTQLDVATVHTGLAEQAFRSQVQAVSAGGNLSAEKVAELEDTRKKFGLSEASAQKIIKGAQNQHLIANMNAAKAAGGLTLQRLLDMEEQGIAIKDVTSDELRASLFTKEMADALSNGSGDFDRERFLEELPKQLGVKEKRVQSALDGLAKDRKRATLVQSVSFLRQKKLEEAVKSLNNLLACHKALPSDRSEAWQPREELLDLWSIYIGRVSDPQKQSDLGRVLALSESETHALRSVVESGQFRLAEEAAEADVF